MFRVRQREARFCNLNSKQETHTHTTDSYRNEAEQKARKSAYFKIDNLFSGSRLVELNEFSLAKSRTVQNLNSVA